MSVVLSISVTSMVVASIGLIITNSFVFSTGIAKAAQESEDVRNILGILNRYSTSSSSIAVTNDSNGNAIVVFDDRTKINLTSSGCSMSGALRAEYIYDYTLPTPLSVGLTGCHESFKILTMSASQWLDQRIMRLKVKIWNSSHVTTVSAKN